MVRRRDGRPPGRARKCKRKCKRKRKRKRKRSEGQLLQPRPGSASAFTATPLITL